MIKEKFVFAFEDENKKWRIEEVQVTQKQDQSISVHDGELKLIEMKALFFPKQFFPTMIFSAWLARRGFMEIDMDSFKILSLPVVFNNKTEENKNG